MDPATIDRTLDLLTAEEVAEGLWFIDICEDHRNMDQAEAEEWRRRIVARREFLELDGTATVNVPPFAT